jgi:hypothetical protein
MGRRRAARAWRCRSAQVEQEMSLALVVLQEHPV